MNSKDEDKLIIVSGTCLCIVILVIVFSIIFNTCCHAGVIDIVKKVPRKAFNIVTNEKFLDNLATISLQVAMFYNAKEDRIGIAQDRTLFGASYDDWHKYKNASRGWLYVYGFCKGMKAGMAIGKEKIDSEYKFKSFLWREIKRTGAQAGIGWVVWQETFHKTGYGEWLDWTPEHNEHRYPNPFNIDTFIESLNQPVVNGLVEAGLLSAGSYILYRER